MKEFDFNEYCVNKLFNEIPEIHSVTGRLKEILEEYIQEGVRAHLVYEDVFAYMTLDLINKKKPKDQERELIFRIFRLIEDLAQHENFEVKCVAEVSFLEPLLNEIQPTKRIEDYALPYSLKLAQHVGSFRFGLNPHTWEKDK